MSDYAILICVCWRVPTDSKSLWLNNIDCDVEWCSAWNCIKCINNIIQKYYKYSKLPSVGICRVRICENGPC